MAYIRTKKIRKKSGNCYVYCYLVENKWKKRLKNSRQKVMAFLGKLYEPKIVKDRDFSSFKSIADISSYVEQHTYKEIVQDLIEWELSRHDMGGYSVDEDKVTKNKHKAVIKMNEGYLCGYTVKKLLNFRFRDDEYEAGMAFARVFVDAGIKIPKQLFVLLFQKMTS